MENNTKCGLEGCNRPVYSSILCHNCWSFKKYRLRYWRQEKAKERKKRKQEQRLAYSIDQNRLKIARKKLENEKRRAKDRPSWQKWRLCKSTARRRGYDFDLSFYEYHRIIEKDECHYCGGRLPPTGGGLDRKDNYHSYTLDNVVACCADCNQIKGDILSYPEMMVASLALKEYRKKT